MAHGFLSYQDSRGKSGIEKALENLVDKKYKELKEHLLKERKKTDQKIEEVSVKVEGPAALRAGQQPLLSGGNQKAVAAAPLQKMLGGTALQKSIAAGPSAVNPDVYGGGLARGGFNGRPLKSEGFVSDRIVNIGATNLGVERDIGGDDMFVKRMEPVGGDSGEVVQAIDRLTMVTMSLVATTKQQTQVQQQIAQTQQQEAEKLGRKSIAAAEESNLERGGDFSSNAAYMGLGANGMALMGAGGGSRRGGGPGIGLGGKAAASALGRSVMKRGGARAGTRLGIALGGKMSKGLGKNLGKKLGGKAIGKLAGGALAKSLGKKIPLVGLGLGAVFAAQRAMQGDFLGAGLELASGAASTVPGFGTAGSIGIDAALAARDMTAMAEGGITDGPVNALIGERGREGVFPLEGSEGRKTFLNFGEGILAAQKKNKKEFARLQAEGLSEYYDKRGGWGSFASMVKKFFGGGDNDDDNSGGGGGGGARRPRSNMAGGGAATFDTIVSGEGGVNSVNRSKAGDTPGGAKSIFGKNLTEMTVGEIMDAQAREEVFAVGKYQIIPDTMKEFVQNSDVTRDMLFTEQTQDMFKDYVINVKRPSVGKYLRGETNDPTEAGQALAREFASVGLQYDETYKGNRMTRGQGLYDGTAGNAASISPEEIIESLKRDRDAGSVPKLIGEKPDSNQDGADWAKSLNLGNEPFIDFGSDNQFRAIKKDSGGYNIVKKGFLGILTPIDTKGKNLGLKEQLIEAAKPKEVSSLNPTTNNDSTSLTASVDDPNALNTASTDAQLTASAGATTINYITNNNTSSGGKSSGGDDVALASSYSQMGPNFMFAPMQLRA